MEAKKNSSENMPKENHEISLKQRNQLTISGVIEVISATSSIVNIKSCAGLIIIGGENLKIQNLDNKEKLLETIEPNTTLKEAFIFSNKKIAELFEKEITELTK